MDRSALLTHRRITPGTPIPAELEVSVEQPRFSFIKRRDDGSIDFVSPVPCPFNYGSVPNTLAADGDREDVIVLGPRLPKNTRLRMPVQGRVHFIDAGVYDGKWVCGHSISAVDRRALVCFFRAYTLAKRARSWWRRTGGATQFLGLELAQPHVRGDVSVNHDSDAASPSASSSPDTGA